MADDPANDPEALALSAVAWTLSDPDRAARLLALTGLDPATLRARIGDRHMQAALIGFLESHEPDLVACAAALDVDPAALVAARQALGR